MHIKWWKRLWKYNIRKAEIHFGLFLFTKSGTHRLCFVKQRNALKTSLQCCIKGTPRAWIPPKIHQHYPPYSYPGALPYPPAPSCASAHFFLTKFPLLPLGNVECLGPTSTPSSFIFQAYVLCQTTGLSTVWLQEQCFHQHAPLQPGQGAGEVLQDQLRLQRLRRQ